MVLLRYEDKVDQESEWNTLLTAAKWILLISIVWFQDHIDTMFFDRSPEKNIRSLLESLSC